MTLKETGLSFGRGGQELKSCLSDGKGNPCELNKSAGSENKSLFFHSTGRMEEEDKMEKKSQPFKELNEQVPANRHGNMPHPYAIKRTGVSLFVLVQRKNSDLLVGLICKDVFSVHS